MPAPTLQEREAIGWDTGFESGLEGLEYDPKQVEDDHFFQFPGYAYEAGYKVGIEARNARRKYLTTGSDRLIEQIAFTRRDKEYEYTGTVL